MYTIQHAPVKHKKMKYGARTYASKSMSRREESIRRSEEGISIKVENSNRRRYMEHAAKSLCSCIACGMLNGACVIVLPIAWILLKVPLSHEDERKVVYFDDVDYLIAIKWFSI